MIKEIVDQQQWNDFLLTLHPNTFLQSWEWGQVQEADGEKVRHVGVYHNGVQVGAALLVTVHARRGRFILCPHGPLFNSAEDAGRFLPEVVEYAREVGREDGAVAVRFAPLMQEKDPNTRLFLELGFRPAPIHIHAELTWVLDVSTSEEEILAGMRKTTRHAVGKAQREGVTIEISTNPVDLERFWPLYGTTGDRHQFTPFTRSFLEHEISAFHSAGRFYFAFARHGGTDVAGAIMIQFGDTIFYHHGASAQIPRGVPAAQLLHWESIREAKRRGAVRYNFWGIAPASKTDHPFAGITVFKQGFGGAAIPYMHLQDLPLNFRYWKLWAIEHWRRQRRGF